jgi:hypothetical protein
VGILKGEPKTVKEGRRGNRRVREVKSHRGSLGVNVVVPAMSANWQLSKLGVCPLRRLGHNALGIVRDGKIFGSLAFSLAGTVHGAKSILGMQP